MTKRNTKNHRGKSRETSGQSVRGTGGKYYKHARLIYHNTGVGKSVIMPRNDESLAIRVALYKYNQRNGYKQLFKTSTVKGNLIIKRLL